MRERKTIEGFINNKRMADSFVENIKQPIIIIIIIWSGQLCRKYRDRIPGDASI